ncbi:MAG TPA: DUF4339 domain-containing protein [Pirellulales bacterium]|nr:DUF4339 domain-containing protein [Pirellulales bacterium]
MSQPPQWYLVLNGQEHGPVTDQQLKELARSGKLQPTHKVRQAAMRKPMMAAKVQGLVFGGLMVKTMPTTPRPQPQAPLDQPSQNGTAPPPPLVAPRESRLNPNHTFMLGIWVGLGLCAAAFTFLAITGRLAPLVAWLETTAKKEEKSKQDAPVAPNETQQPVVSSEADQIDDAEEVPSTSVAGTLTPDFYPYRDGVRKRWDSRWFLSNGMEHMKTEQDIHIGNGIIRSVTTKWVGIANGKTVDLLAAVPNVREPKNTHYRQRGGFVEISLNDPNKDPIPTWQTLIKLGAKPGDQWKNSSSSSVSYKLLRFEHRQLSISGVAKDKTLIAIIEERMEDNFVSEHELALGIGPISFKSWTLKDGKKSPAGVNTLVALEEK